MRQRTNPQRTNPQRTNPEVKRQDARYAQVQPADSAASSASAQHAIQVALDRRDNGGDVHTGDDE